MENKLKIRPISLKTLKVLKQSVVNESVINTMIDTISCSEIDTLLSFGIIERRVSKYNLGEKLQQLADERNEAIEEMNTKFAPTIQKAVEAIMKLMEKVNHDPDGSMIEETEFRTEINNWFYGEQSRYLQLRPIGAIANYKGRVAYEKSRAERDLIEPHLFDVTEAGKKFLETGEISLKISGDLFRALSK